MIRIGEQPRNRTIQAELKFWNDILKRVTYKPKVKLWVKEQMGNLLLVMTQELPDATGRVKGAFTVELADRLPSVDSETDAIEVIRSVIFKAEMHEIDEWLRLDGERVTEPHSELRGAAA